MPNNNNEKENTSLKKELEILKKENKLLAKQLAESNIVIDTFKEELIYLAKELKKN